MFMYKDLVLTLAWVGCHSWLVILGLEKRLSDFTVVIKQTIMQKNYDIRLKLKSFQTEGGRRYLLVFFP